MTEKRTFETTKTNGEAPKRRRRKFRSYMAKRAYYEKLDKQELEQERVCARVAHDFLKNIALMLVFPISLGILAFCWVGGAKLVLLALQDETIELAEVGDFALGVVILLLFVTFLVSCIVWTLICVIKIKQKEMLIAEEVNNNR